MATNTIVTESVQPTGGSKAHLDDLATASNSSSHHDEDAQPWAKDGIWRVPLSPLLTASDCHYWAQEFSRVTPMIMAGEGDNEYPLYRNLINEYSNDDNDNENDDNNNHANDDDIQQFPLNDIIRLVAPTLRQHFGVGEVQQTATTNRHHASSSSSSENNNHRDELPLVRLDDAFGLHYNMQQSDTTGALHTDPSDITINICLHASEDIQGSHVVFHHHDHGLTTPGLLSLSSSAGANATNDDDRDAGGTTSTTPSAADERNPSSPRDTVDSSSLHPRPASSSRTTAALRRNADHDHVARTTTATSIPPQPGYALIHWGHHPHETTALRAGQRTNVIMTLCCVTAERSSTRACYHFPNSSSRNNNSATRNENF